MESAETAVTNAYGSFVRYVLDKDDEEFPTRNGGGGRRDGRYREDAANFAVSRDNGRVAV